LGASSRAVDGLVPNARTYHDLTPLRKLCTGCESRILKYGVNVLVLNPDPFARLGLGWMA
jgi:hypothetical protein